MFHPSKDHPRLCGEKKGLDAKNFFLKGSPPPMRGKVKNSNDISMSERITPAYAGKRFDQFVIWIMLYGSPPPMRGKAFGRIHAVIRQGITPAYAGKSYGYYTIEVSF